MLGDIAGAEMFSRVEKLGLSSVVLYAVMIQESVLLKLVCRRGQLSIATVGLVQVT